MDIPEIILLLIAAVFALYISGLLAKRRTDSAFKILHIDEIEFSQLLADSDSSGIYQLIDRCYFQQELLLRRRFYMFASKLHIFDDVQECGRKIMDDKCRWSTSRTRTLVLIDKFPYFACHTTYGAIEFKFYQESRKKVPFTSDAGLEFVDEFCEIKMAYDAINIYCHDLFSRKS